MISGLTELAERAFPRTVFDAMPIPSFVVDEDIRILDFNKAASQLLGSEPELALHQRGGEALHCITSEAAGCGRGVHCKNCVIRNSVNRSIAGGATQRQIHRAQWRANGKTRMIDLLVTASPVPGPDAKTALLILEDVSELLTLRGLLPICAQCKKVRDDE